MPNWGKSSQSDANVSPETPKTSNVTNTPQNLNASGIELCKKWSKMKNDKCKWDRILLQMTSNECGKCYLLILQLILHKTLTKRQMQVVSKVAPNDHKGCGKYYLLILQLILHKKLTKWQMQVKSKVAPNDLKWMWEVLFADITADFTQRVDQMTNASGIESCSKQHQMDVGSVICRYYSWFYT